ncbi:PD-(D/E)XK nuclease family protein [Verrucomicrobiaceae bacterium E54]|nr:PD-(D/E)XK nuclease family protein [Verrucomicrobiaceae bacterium E54]
MRLDATIARSNHAEGRSFNPLPWLKIGETMHSRILGDFLDPQGSHGQGAIFLMPFLEELGVPEPQAGIWHVTVETGRVDILIWRNEPRRSAVIIENKAKDAVDQLNQIYRYWHHEVFLWDPAAWPMGNPMAIEERRRDFHVVYLPTGKDKGPAAHSMERPQGMEKANPWDRVPLKCTIMPLADLMELWERESVGKVPPTNHRLNAFIGLYQELWKK